MSEYLLDTHALIWFLQGDEHLSEKTQEIISDETSTLYLSIVSLWEMAIKISLGKLKLSQPLEQVISSLGSLNINLLPIKENHVLGLLNMPFVHRDPFDRLLISQALEENLNFISNEAMFLDYGIKTVW
jgi:PIN domain nuclease of toxin-antitoxin system